MSVVKNTKSIEGEGFTVEIDKSPKEELEEIASNAKTEKEESMPESNKHENAKEVEQIANKGLGR